MKSVGEVELKGRQPPTRPSELIQQLQGQVQFQSQVLQRLAVQVADIHAVTFRANESVVDELRAEVAEEQARAAAEEEE